MSEHLSANPLQPAAADADHVPDYEVACLRLLQQLPGSLDPAEVLRCFHRGIQPLVPCDGLCYRPLSPHTEQRFGRSGRCRLIYRLRLEELELGELTLSRRTRFVEAETHMLESLTGFLLQPLRNALLYQEALLMARRDPLTGLANRAALDETLQRELQLAQRHGEPLALAVLDVDDFKLINDSHGHLTGDRVLARLGELICANARQSDLAFRYGGDEFVLLMARTPAAGAVQVVERIRSAVAAEPRPGFGLPSGYALGLSAGLAAAQPADDAASLFDRADRALLQGKRRGRRRLVVL